MILFSWVRRALHAFVLLFLLCLAPLAAQAGSYVWTGNASYRSDIPVEQRNDNWHNEFNWEPQGIPTGGDSATIDTRYRNTVFVDQPITVQNLTIAGDGNPTITSGTGGNDLTVTGTFNWFRGVIGGNGFGTMVIPAGATLNLPGPEWKNFTGVLNSAGTINWSGTGRFNVGGSSIVNNTSLMNITAEGAYFGKVEGPGPVLNNTGTIRRSAGAGLFSIAGFDAAATDSLRGFLNNSGTVDVQTGTFQFHEGRSTGTFNVATGALILANGHQLNGNAISGAGIFRVDGGEANGTLTRNGGPLELVGGWRGGFSDTAGSSATLNGTGKFLWQSGYRDNFSGTWTLGANLHTECSGGDAKEYDGTITNKGTFDWLGGGPIACNNTSFINQGTFNCKAEGTFLADTYINGQTFENRGTLNTFAGTNTATETVLLNSGVLNVGGAGVGTLNWSGLNNSGTINLGVGDVLNSPFYFEPTAKLNVDIAGAADGQFGLFRSDSFNGTANGTLTANFVNGYSPPAGTTFRVFAAHRSSSSPLFSSVKAQNLPAKTVVPVYDPNGYFVDIVVQDLALSINDVSVLEGNVGTTGNVNFTVTLSNPAAQAVTVNYATANSTAVAPADYTAKTGTLTIPAGQTKGIISIAIAGDALDETDESFFLNISAAVGATIADAQGRATIIDNDATPTLSISNSAVIEGDSGTQDAPFTVTLSAPSGKTVSVGVIPSNGTAISPADYTTGGATLVFAPGETTKTFNVPVKGDLADENDEQFYALLSSPVNASISAARAVCEIVDNDAAPTISITGLQVKEYNGGQTTAAFRLTLSAPSGKVVKVNYATSNGTATAGSDYTAVAPTQVSFSVGSTTAYARVIINGDELPEANESINVNLSSPVEATISTGTAIGTIINDDSNPSLSINDVSVTEGNSGTKNLTFTVTLSKPSALDVTVNYASANGTAVSTSDYTAKSGTLTFAPGGPLTKTISIAINGDTVTEGNETLFVLLSGVSNASVSKARGVGTITNDDASG